MPINGSVSEGDANRILEDLEEDYFPPDFKEYMLKEQLKWSRHEKVDFFVRSHWGWVFWSQQDHEIELSLSLDNCTGFNPDVCAIPKVRNNIRHALRKLISSLHFNGCLAQFWAPTTTSEGRTLLTTQFQPFALGQSRTRGSERNRLCEYRMKMCMEYFYADVESTGEEQLGLPGRVFLHKFLESTPDVNYYSTKEYPQRNLAVSCNIKQSLAVPVFEHCSQTCVGVLEIVSLDNRPLGWHILFLQHMHDILQEFGLQCFDGYKICEMQELNRVLRSVCRIHELPLAMTWVPCNACDGLLRGQLWSKLGFSTGVEFSARMNADLEDFLEIGKCSHLRKGLVAGRALSSLNMLYCSDITQLSVDEYPLVTYARQCKLSGWFTMCLQSLYTGNDIYVLEFFMSARSKDDGNIQTRLSFILGTMEEKFETFRLASGKALGELMSFEVINFQNDQKVHSVQLIQATRNFSSISSDPSSVRSSPSVASTMHSVQLIQATRNFSSLSSNLSSMQSSASVANTRPGFEDANMVTIKAKYACHTIIFKLSLPCRLVELQQEVAKSLKLDETFHVHYEDYEDELAELILIACDEDLQAWVDTSIAGQHIDCGIPLS